MIIKKRTETSKLDYSKLSHRLFCLQVTKKLLRFWPITLLVNLGPTWLIQQTGSSGSVMTFLTWALFPPMLLVCEIFFLLLGALAEIPAEMIADALFPRLPGKDASPEELADAENNDSLWAILPKSWRAGILIFLACSLAIGGLLLTREPKATTTVEITEPAVQVQAQAVPTVPAKDPETITESQAQSSAPSETTISIPGSTGPVAYEIQRWDRSYTDSEGRDLMTYYYDYAILHSQEPAHQKISQTLYSNAEAFMTQRTQEQIETPVMSIFNTISECIDTTETEVTHSGDGVFSILLTTNTYSGGNHSIKNRYGETYSLQTGELLTLSQLTQMEDDALLQALQESACAYFSDNNPIVFEDAKQILPNYTLDQFQFVVQDGEIVLLFKTYQFTAGVAGPQSVPTGILIQPTA